MLIIEIQKNIVQVKSTLTGMENSFMYRIFCDGKITECRQMLIDSISVRNSILTVVHHIITTTRNKDLIKTMDLEYFDKIIEATSKESLIRIVGTSAVSIPDTTAKIMLESKEIGVQMDKIKLIIDDYNVKIADFRQKNSWFYNSSELPELIESPLTLHGLLDVSDDKRSIPALEMKAEGIKSASKLTIRMKK